MRVHRFVLGVGGVAAGLLVATATAWACVSGPSVTLNPVNAKPGETVTMTMRDFRKVDNVDVRWNAINGPLLASFTQNGSGTPFTGAITVPADAKPGNYVLLLSQTAPDGKLSQMPVRALITVTSPDGAVPVLGASVSPVDESRGAGLVSDDESVSGGALALVALGVAGVGMFLAGMAALFAGRRGKAPETAQVRR